MFFYSLNIIKNEFLSKSYIIHDFYTILVIVVKDYVSELDNIFTAGGIYQWLDPNPRRLMFDNFTDPPRPSQTFVQDHGSPHLETDLS